VIILLRRTRVQARDGAGHNETVLFKVKALLNERGFTRTINDTRVR
jgi:hypothetical protein